MSDYQDRLDAKADKAAKRAARLRSEADTTLEQAKALGAVVPFGQPVITGHHSEKADRRHRRRVAATYDKGFRLHDAADDAARAAARAGKRAAGEGPIESDDPEAVTKAKAELVDAQRVQESLKAVNRIVRSKADEGTKIERMVTELGLSESTARAYLQPDFAGRVGVTPATLRNNLARIKRLKDRIVGLEAHDVDAEFEFEGVGWWVGIDHRGRVAVVLDERHPDAGSWLVGWRWTPSDGSWTRKDTLRGREAGRVLAGRLPGLVG